MKYHSPEKVVIINEN